MLTSHRRYLGSLAALIAGTLAFALLTVAPALAGPTVTVRVEGESSTLLPLKTVTLGAPEPVSGCPANSVAAAINLAVEANWDHGEAGEGGGDFTETILAETHAFTHESDTWAVWVDDKWGGGICTDLLSEGDEVLMVADHEPPPYAPTVLPLVVSEVPTAVQAGVPFSLKVSAVHTPPGTFAEPGQGTPQPIEGATVSGAGISATSGASGVATLTPTSVGQLTLRATKAGDAPSRPFVVCVHNGSDGNCGTTATGSTGTSASGTSGSGAALPAAPYRGPFALAPRVTGLIDGHVYAHGRAPRVLAGTVLAHDAVSSVSLELRRRYRGRCSAYDGTRERFVAARCGVGRAFRASTGGAFSYLLPFSLPPGRYVLDIQASDAAGNHVTPARGTSRLVFYVR